jgi:hypothetical protein
MISTMLGGRWDQALVARKLNSTIASGSDPDQSCIAVLDIIEAGFLWEVAGSGRGTLN